MILEGTQLIKYKDVNFKIKERVGEKSIMDCLDEFMLTDNYNSFRKLEFVYGNEIIWSEDSIERNFSDFINLELGHANDCDYSIEDVLSKSFDDKIFNVKSELVRKNRWNFIITQDVYYRKRINVSLFGIDEWLAREITHSEAESLMDKIVEYLNVGGNDLLIKKVQNDNAAVIFSIKEGRYIAYKNNNARGEYYFDCKYDNLISSIL